MKNLLIKPYLYFFFGFFFFSNALSAQINIPVIGEGTTQTDCVGTLRDAGGSGSYPNNMNSFITIAPENATSLQLIFTEFNTEEGNDYIEIYDGESINSPLIGRFDGEELPSIDDSANGIITASNAVLTIQMTTNAIVQKSGFVAEWFADGGTDASQASFEISDTNTPMNSPVFFMDASQNAGFWLWDFGDGNTSNEQFPTHIYETAGDFIISLTISNCGEETSSFSQNISVQAAANISLSAQNFDITIAYGDSATQILEMANLGNGDLVIEILGATLISEKPYQVVALLNFADLDSEYANSLAAISSFGENYELFEISTNDANELQAVLAGKDVLFIPEQEECAVEGLGIFAEVLHDFASQGGKIIFSGTNQSACLFDTNLFSGTYGTYVSGLVHQNLPEDALFEGVNNPYLSENMTFCYDITNNDVVRLAEYITDDNDTLDVVAYRNIGEGQAILIGHDFMNQNENTDRLLSNAIKNRLDNSLNWLYVSAINDTISAGNTNNIILEFNATNVYGGTYYLELLLTSNDANQEQIVIPCTLHITGTPAFETSVTEINFGDVINGFSASQNIEITNNGTDSLYIYEVFSDIPDLTIDENVFELYGGGSSQAINLAFSPTATGNYDGFITFITNIGTFEIPIFANAVGSPQATISPTEIDVTLDVGTSTNISLNIENNGEGLLHFAIDTSKIAQRLQVLAYTRGTDIANEYANTIAAIDEYFTNYDLDETTTADLNELADLLKNYQVFLVPEIEDSEATDLFLDFSEILEQYVENGGTIVFAGTAESIPLVNTGLMQGQAFENSTEIITLTDIEHPITADLNAEFFPSNGTYTFFALENEIVQLATQANEDSINMVIGYQNLGEGRVVYVGFDYFEAEENAKKALANTMKWIASELVVWLDFETLENTVSFPNGSYEIDILADATNLLGGTYTTEIDIETNDPNTPYFTIPITLTVVGTPLLELSENSLDFGNVIVGNSETLNLSLQNTGTDTLFIENISSSSLNIFSINLEENKIEANESADLSITFSPDAIANFGTTLIIETNIGQFSVSLNGNGQGIPTINLSPNSLEIDLLGNENSTETVTISNNGEGALDFWLNGNTAQATEILVYNYATLGSNINILTSGLSDFLENYNLTTYNGTSTNEFAQLLANKQVLIFPKQITQNLNIAVLEAFAPIVQNFVNEGGSLIFLGTDCEDCINATGLLEANFAFALLQDNVVVTNDTHPITQDLPADFSSPLTSFAYHFSNTDMQVLAQNELGASVLAYRKSGLGNVIYFGYNFQTSDNLFAETLAKTVNWATGLPPQWLSYNSFGENIAINNSFDLSLNFDATNLFSGTYTFDLQLYTNIPTTPLVLLPCTLNISNIPTANFDTNTPFSCDNEISFSDISLNEPTAWLWNFGDGETSSEQNPTHFYENEGTYNVSLEACNDIGCNDILLENFVTIDAASNYCDTILMNVQEPLILTACNGVLQDDGGNGDYTDSLYTIVTIAPENAFSVTLTFTEFELETGWDYLRIYDGDIETGAFLGNFTGVFLPYDDGVIVGESGMLTLIMETDDNNNRSGFTASWGCFILSEPPTPNFMPNITEECTGTVQFNDLTTNYPATWLWYFGDGTVSGEQFPTHSYAQSGTYTVVLETCNIAGCQIFEQEITLEDVMFSDFSYSEIEVGLPSQFVNLTENAVNCVWNWGDGTQNTQGICTPLHIYETIGSYDLILTVTNDENCTRSITKTINVYPVGIENFERKNIHIYPNPASEKLYIVSENFNTKNISFSLYNNLGKQVWESEKIDFFNTEILDMSDFSSGVYFLKIADEKGDKVFFEKIVKF
ncbi:MAG: PKD domain-containing protein [Chitinophagales bacterium]